MKKKFLLFVLGGLLFVLLSSISEMPSLGSAESPSYNEVAHYYVDNAVEDTNTANVISAIITDYRAFDTLGETTVLFTSIAAVISVMSVSGKTPKVEKKEAE
ncbi:hypothetical protein Amet_4155 [Alkaliphilus metalliredigens QYMF]|uniref:MrpA C-terminal/MbhE domain-containing protein n=1 Tax=Alkaliphilus metalliredigens (strain QYMF) TaxID=293826 RepID=A6TVL8_ALKMQ|nr:hydrogen gas-evolving membrane-bound hydrogenase subunit E [Alkaliphilus metalliredigens]ABR50236.1 hypothetical protein Amet_4155 [Alkaliphilus metalliredigens QYMF]